MASKSPVLAQVRPDGLEDAPQLQIDIDRDKANALGVTFDSINSALSTALGSSYVNDFPNQGRLQRVVVQADAPARMQPDDLLKLNASNSRASPCRCRPSPARAGSPARMQTVRYNGYPGDAHRRQRRAGLQHRRRDGRDGKARGPAAAGLRL